MAVIEDGAKADRFARAILADVALYNEETIRASADLRAGLAEPIGEGRELFRSRVSPRLHRSFEDALATWIAGLEAARLPPPPPGPSAAPPLPAAAVDPPSPAARPAPAFGSATTERPHQGGVLPIVVLLGLLLALAAGYWALR